MRTIVYLVISATIMLLTSCRVETSNDNLKENAYRIEDICHYKSKAILDMYKEMIISKTHKLFVIASDGKNLRCYSDGTFGTLNNEMIKFDMYRGFPIVNGLNYSNVNRAVHDDDIAYFCYNQNKDVFYLMLEDFNKTKDDSYVRCKCK